MLLVWAGFLVVLVSAIFCPLAHGAAGELESGFDPNANGEVYSAVLQADGKILMGGNFTSVSGVTRNYIARLNSDGTIDTGFNPNANGAVSSVIVQADGKILLGGHFTSLGAVTRNRIARLNADGTVEAAFNPSASHWVSSLALTSDGRIVVGGSFTSIAGQSRTRIARLNRDGSLDTSFDPGGGFNAEIWGLFLQPDGSVLTTGLFTTFAGVNRNYLARLASNGSLDTGFNPGTNGTVAVACCQPDGKIVIGGGFSTVGGTAALRLARLNSNGSLDSSFNVGSGVNEQVRSIALQADGKVLIGGSFTSVNGVACNGIARLTTTGGVENSIQFGIGTGANGTVHGITLQTDGRVLVCGTFNTFNSAARNRIARLANDAATQTLTAVNSAQVLWQRQGSLPELGFSSFEWSTDAGISWTQLGLATRVAGGWNLGSINLPPSALLRARGLSPGGMSNVSAGIVEQVTPYTVTPQPDIVVEQPSGTSISDNGSVLLEGGVVGTSTSTTFTIRNIGYADLTGLGITIDGTHAGDFSVITSPAAPVAGGGSTSFTIRFTPAAAGARTAALHIASNDSDESPFDINLTGVGVSNTTSPGYQPLAQAEYFVGADPGQGNGTPLALAGSPGLARDLADITIPVGSLPPGTHNVGVRVRDEAGRWSNALIRRFTVSSFTLAGGVSPEDPNLATSFAKPFQPLTQAEYFVGSDPGQGNGTPLALAGSDGLARDLANVAIPLDLPPGTYHVGVRVRDEAGRWSNALIRRYTLYRTEVLASQRAGNKLVDLEFDLLDGTRAYTVSVLISQDGGLTWTVPTASVTGDVGSNVAPGRVKRIVWHAGEDWNNGFSENMRFRVIAYETVQDTPSGFASVTPRTFSMGSPAGEVGRAGDETERTVVMGKPFFLKTTEVTWTEWNAVRNQGATYGYTDIAAGRNGLNGDGTGNHPVTDVSWVDVVKWCNLRSEIEGKKPVYYSDASLNPATVVRTGLPTVHALWNANGYRLPTEAEWEAACRAGTTTGFHSGVITNATSDPNLDLVGWYAANSGANTRTVGGKTANALGLRDMHGNVREWCWDAYDAYPEGPQWNPVSASTGAARVLRGGSWNLPAAACRSAARSSGGQNSRATDVGFRVALNHSGLTDVFSPSGVPVDSRDPAPGNLIAGLRPAVNGAVLFTLGLGDGKILLGGDFTQVDGQPRNRVARLNADGSLDSSFNPGADSTVHCAAVLPDGKILLGGDFSSVAGGPADFLARLNPDGSLDDTFHPSFDYTVTCLALQTDGRIVVAGEFAQVEGEARNRIARLLPDGTLDGGFNPNADARVLSLAIQADGKILLGGGFTSVGGQPRNGLARVNADGSLDTAFLAGADGEVTCLALQANGQILVGGAFSQLAGQSCARLGRLSTSGVLDSTFTPNPNGIVRSISLLADGRILIGGEFTTVAGGNRDRFAALGAGGLLETAFQISFNGPVQSLHVLPTGRVLVGGTFGSANGVTRQGVAWLDNSAPSESLAALSSSRIRWLRGGSAPEASMVHFDLSTDGGVTWLPLGHATRISGGWERLGVNLPANGSVRGRARIPGGKSNGSSAQTAATAAFSGLVTIPEIAVETSAGTDVPDGGSHAYGAVTLGTSKAATFVIRNLGYGNLTGLSITREGANPADFQVSVAPSAPVTGPGGSTTFTVQFTPSDAGLRSATLRIANNDTNENPFDITLSGSGVIAGQLADDYDPAVNNRVHAIAMQPDGQVLVGGAFTSVAGQARGRFARLNPDLTPEAAATFAAGSGANSNVLAIAVQADRKILLTGQFTSINAQSRNRIARLLPDGALESTGTFNVGTGANNTVQTLSVQRDGKILVAGDFTTFNGQSRPRIARLHSDGTLEGLAGFDMGSGFDGTVNCMAVQPDGAILVGGSFTAFNGQSRPRLARLNANGTLDSSFAPVVDGKVSCMVLQPDGKLLIGGLFTSVNGMARAGLARLLPDGTVEGISTFDPGSGMDGEVTSLALQANRSILVAGAFSMVNNEARAGIARLYPNGTLEDSVTFDTVVGPDAPVRGVALRQDGAVIVGGDFIDYNGTPRSRLALLANQIASEELVVGSSTRVDWNRAGTAPEFADAELEVSTDGGSTWLPVAAMKGKTGGWEVSDAALPSVGLVRARGRRPGGQASSSSGLSEMAVSYLNAPALATQPASEITTNAALLNATVVPNGSARVRFEYGPTAAFGFSTPVQTLTGGAVIAFSAPVTGLSGLYHFRVVAETAGGTYFGAPLTFLTAPELPTAVTSNPVSVTTSGATLVGTVNPKGRETTVYFEWGATALFGNVTPSQTLPAGGANVEITAPLTGLAADATYHYRIVAVNSEGTAFGSGVSFVAGSGSGSPTSAPSVTTGGAINLATDAATLQGTVNPNGGFTNAYFEYGTTASLGAVTTALGAGNGSVPVNLSAPVTGLSPGTEHFYRLVAVNSLGTTQGNLQTFTTRFLPPTVETGGSSAISTTSVRVTGSVRARHAATQVFFDYGTDGVDFPNTLAATPAAVTGDGVTAVSADLVNLLQGTTYHFRVRAVNEGGTSLGATASFQVDILSGLLQQFPPAPPAATGAVTVVLTPSEGITHGWRFVGEQQWRPSGSTASGLTTGDRDIEFRPVPGYLQPPQEIVGVVSGEPVVVVERDYFETPDPGTGGLTVTLKPDAIAAAAVPSSDRAQWRLLGEDNTQWRDTGAVITGLNEGSYLVECKPVAGRTTPRVTSVLVEADQTSAPVITYRLTDAPAGAPPAVLPFVTVSADTTKPYAYVGQIVSNAGASTGFVVKPRVVATAGHVVFDDGTLSAAEGLQWQFQRDAGNYEPTPLYPRGFYIFDGYAAQRTLENTPGTSSPQSQTLDVAALYFVEDAGRGGYGGYLASDLNNNEFLLSGALKTLVGYPVEGVPLLDQGRMHATAPASLAFTAAFGRTFTTTAIRSFGGNSGGPLCVQHSNGQFYPAAIYLGGTGQTVVRAIDSQVIDLFKRAETSGDGGQNNTGGGITHTSVTKLASALAGGVKVNITPAGAVSAGAGWRLKPETTYRTSGALKSGLKAGRYVLQMRTVSGYQVPTAPAVSVTAGQLTTVTFAYAANLTALQSWRQTHFGTTSNSGNAADTADPDGDGMNNISEYEAGTNPTNAGDVFVAQSVENPGPGFTLSAPGKTGRIYTLQRSSSLQSASWIDITSQGPLAAPATVTLTDTESPSPPVFYRIQVSRP